MTIRLPSALSIDELVELLGNDLVTQFGRRTGSVDAVSAFDDSHSGSELTFLTRDSAKVRHHVAYCRAAAVIYEDPIPPDRVPVETGPALLQVAGATLSFARVVGKQRWIPVALPLSRGE